MSIVANIGDYEQTYANFDWEAPEKFNFGRDVVDHWAAQERAPSVWLGIDGEERRFDLLAELLASSAAEGVRKNGT